MATADPTEDDVSDALQRGSSRRDRASPDPAGAEQEESGRCPPAALGEDEPKLAVLPKASYTLIGSTSCMTCVMTHNMRDLCHDTSHSLFNVS